MLKRLAPLLLVLAACLSAAPQPALAQYRDTEDFYAQRPDRRPEAPGRQPNVAGDFDYYSLVLSWSPSYCVEATGDEQQCGRRDGRRFNFVLHGLWPQYERGWPQDCRTARRPFVPQPLIDSMLDIMPSQRLVIHEYRKHGTCSGLSAEAYFALSRRLFKSITIPQDFRNPFEQQSIEPRELSAALIRANPGLKQENFAIVCGGSGNRLKEVRICYTKDAKLRACGANENPRKLCSAQRILVPPVRSTARDDLTPQAPKRFDNPLPGPRMDGVGRGI